MNRTNFLKILNTDVQKWCERHGIMPLESPCNECGVTLHTTIPVASREFRGLMADQCQCGNEDVPYCFVRESRAGGMFKGVEEPVSSPQEPAKKPYPKIVFLKLPDSSYG
jgi:hypothetical protein